MKDTNVNTQLFVQLPLGRSAYQTNEMIDLTVIRAARTALPDSILHVEITSDDGSRLSFRFDVAPVAIRGKQARGSIHLRLNGWLLRPGSYRLHVKVDGEEAETSFTLYSHFRQSSFRLLHWGSRAEGDAHIGEGAEGMGFNLIYGEDFRPHSNPARNAECCIIGGVDFMQVCTMSGSHQMDLRQECDWSDPYVVRGGAARVVQQAFANRTQPNCLGVHFYDEPGLTWQNGSPHGVTPQLKAFYHAFGTKAPDAAAVSIDNHEWVSCWRQWGRWRESFMEGAWKDARAGVEKVKATLVSANQSQYCWNAYTDGCYFNFARNLPVISGHGGYSDGPATYIYPVYHHEFGRMRDLNKPVWYLPTWYNMSSDNFRLEQNMSFMTGLQGMATPPWFEVGAPQGKAESQGVVECNKMMAKLGTIFTTMPVTRGEVALLYSLDQCLDAQIKSGLTDNYEGGGHTRAALLQLYVAGKMLHTSLMPVVEEDILDGTLAAHHKALIIARVHYLSPQVISALQGYIESGGTVIVSDECEVEIPGAVRLGAPSTNIQYDLLNSLWKEGKHDESLMARNPGDFMKEAEPVANALRAHFTRLGILPDLEVSSPSVFANRHSSGDFEYFFVLNATYDPVQQHHLACKATSADISVPADGRPIYDAMHGGEVSAFQPDAGNRSTAKFTFGPGQLRAFARTARPIGGVQAAVSLFRDYTLEEAPIQLRLTAMVVDYTGAMLIGSAPLRIRLVDALGTPRYDFFRATKDGVLQLALPLAANDPLGEWRVEVTELLANTTGVAAFTYAAPGQCGALLGAIPRAVYFGDDREHIFQFVRAHQAIAIVIGDHASHAAAATQLAASLHPWGVRARIINAADVQHARSLSAEEAETWVGIERGAATPGDGNSPLKVGFALDGPAILLGTPDNNPIIGKLAEWGFLPYTAANDFPGNGRGYLAWQYHGIGIGLESITCIAADEEGMMEAIGTLYEAAAGLEPLLPSLPARQAVVVAANVDTRLPELTIAWQRLLPDRPTAMRVDGGLIRVATNDGTLSIIDAEGVVQTQLLSPLEVDPYGCEVPVHMQRSLLRGRAVKQVIKRADGAVILYWGGTVQGINNDGIPGFHHQLPFDAVVIDYQENTLLAALSDGTLLALR